MTTQPTHPGLAYLRALALVRNGGTEPSAEYRANEAALDRAEDAIALAGYPTDLVPESDLRAAERDRDDARAAHDASVTLARNSAAEWSRQREVIAGYQSDILERENEAKQARRERDEAQETARILRETLAAYRADIASLHGWIDRLKAENARLTRGPLGRLRALWGGR